MVDLQNCLPTKNFFRQPTTFAPQIDADQDNFSRSLLDWLMDTKTNKKCPLVADVFDVHKVCEQIWIDILKHIESAHGVLKRNEVAFLCKHLLETNKTYFVRHLTILEPPTQENANMLEQYSNLRSLNFDSCANFVKIEDVGRQLRRTEPWNSARVSIAKQAKRTSAALLDLMQKQAMARDASIFARFTKMRWAKYFNPVDQLILKNNSNLKSEDLRTLLRNFPKLKVLKIVAFAALETTDFLNALKTPACLEELHIQGCANITCKNENDFDRFTGLCTLDISESPKMSSTIINSLARLASVSNSLQTIVLDNCAPWIEDCDLAQLRCFTTNHVSLSIKNCSSLTKDALELLTYVSPPTLQLIKQTLEESWRQTRQKTTTHRRLEYYVDHCSHETKDRSSVLDYTLSSVPLNMMSVLDISQVFCKNPVDLLKFMHCPLLDELHARQCCLDAQSTNDPIDLLFKNTLVQSELKSDFLEEFDSQKRMDRKVCSLFSAEHQLHSACNCISGGGNAKEKCQLPQCQFELLDIAGCFFLSSTNNPTQLSFVKHMRDFLVHFVAAKTHFMNADTVLYTAFWCRHLQILDLSYCPNVDDSAIYALTAVFKKRVLKEENTVALEELYLDETAITENSIKALFDEDENNESFSVGSYLRVLSIRNCVGLQKKTKEELVENAYFSALETLNV